MLKLWNVFSDNCRIWKYFLNFPQGVTGFSFQGLYLLSIIYSLVLEVPNWRKEWMIDSSGAWENLVIVKVSWAMYNIFVKFSEWYYFILVSRKYPEVNKR